MFEVYEKIDTNKNFIEWAEEKRILDDSIQTRMFIVDVRKKCASFKLTNVAMDVCLRPYSLQSMDVSICKRYEDAQI